MLWAATSHDVDKLGGLYLEDVNVARLMREDEPDNFGGGIRAHAIDKEAANILWQISEKFSEI